MNRIAAIAACATALALALAVAPVLATTYYVSPGGDDGNPGTSPAAAWRTPGRVNAAAFLPGDSVLFEGGQTFTGGLVFDSGDAGTGAHRVTVSSYGSGRAIISPTSGNGCTVTNAGGLVISNLVFAGPGRLNASGGRGILLQCNTAGGEKYDDLDVVNVECRENYEAGIQMTSGNASDPGFRHVLFAGCDIHDNGRNGMTTDGVWQSTAGDPHVPHQDVTIRDCAFHHNTGLTGQSSHSGSGLILGFVDGGLVEYCEAYDNGENNTYTGGGPVGLWAWESRNVVFQFNESHHNRTQTKDGGGFDLDGGCIGCVMQYNYSHDNVGEGFGIFQFQGAHTYRDNVVRYNITQNEGSAGIYFWATNSSGAMHNTLVHHNTIYVGPAQAAAGVEDMFVKKDFVFDTRVYDNIIVGAAGKTLINIPRPSNGWDFRGNCYYSYGDTNVTLSWNRVVYTSLAALRTATGQEDSTGFQADPRLAAAGGGGTIGDPHALGSLAAYRLLADSPLIDHGLDLAARYGIDPGARDFYGTVVPSVVPSGGACDVGACETPGAPASVGAGADLALRLEPAAPNPFRDRTHIRFALARGGFTSLRVFDPGGRLVRRLVEGDLAEGPHAAPWDGRDEAGRLVPPGVYLVQLRAGGTVLGKRIVRLN